MTPLRAGGLLLALAACAPPDDSDSAVDVEPDPTASQLQSFYQDLGDREGLPATLVDPIETLLLGQDEVARGEHAAARARVDALLQTMPLSTPVWRESVGYEGLNVGDPVAYYGVRMLDLMADASSLPDLGAVQMTAVVAPCAVVTRPTLPELEPETLQRHIHPDLLAEDGRVVRQSTDLFRHWVHAISGGVSVELEIHTLEACTTVDYRDDGSVIVSYPDAQGMIGAVSDEVVEATDIWWVVAPSGVPGDGSGYGRHFITGGMGGHGMGQPLFISDDAWFLRKPEHLGSGPYTDVERRVYHPQWFQHEFMHHLFRTWPEYGLEVTEHMWFDRQAWPADFEGVYEADYYAEAIERRLSTASPSIAEALDTPLPAFLDDADLPRVDGRYLREPVLNEWHQVTVTVGGQGATWTNATGVSWSMSLVDGGLHTGAECPYGEVEVLVEEAGDRILALWFLGERYGRVD